MKEVADESVHLIITSPPYWQLKDYGNGKQIGFNDTYEAYIQNPLLLSILLKIINGKKCRKQPILNFRKNFLVGFLLFFL
ncbi:MAG: DNA methyltransferase [Candidatus Methanoperedens sp.]|nr:DNA methyltransferase [Candidatus Methanoperedens sp.]